MKRNNQFDLVNQMLGLKRDKQLLIKFKKMFDAGVEEGHRQADNFPSLKMIADFCRSFRDGMTEAEIRKTGFSSDFIALLWKAGYLQKRGKTYQYYSAMAESHLMKAADVYKKLKEAKNETTTSSFAR